MTSYDLQSSAIEKRIPILGIAVPTFNRAAYLRDSLASICREIRKSSSRVSLTVCDNASEDDTTAVVACAKADIPEIRVFRNAVNIGGVANILRCVENVEAEWIWILPDDCILEPGILDSIIIHLQTVVTPIVYTRCVLWQKNELDIHGKISIGSMFRDHCEVWQHLSWLPCLLLRRDAVLGYIPQAYRLGCHSYPHLVLAILALRNSPPDANLTIIPAAFRTVNKPSQETKRYSWVHGAIWRFAKTMYSCLPLSDARRILRLSARKEKWGRQVFAHMPTEYSIIPTGTPWSLVRQYGFTMLPAWILFLWFCFCPQFLKKWILRIAYFATARGPLVRFNKVVSKIDLRLSTPANLEPDF